jgi:hypothetical protein
MVFISCIAHLLPELPILTATITTKMYVIIILLKGIFGPSSDVNLMLTFTFFFINSYWMLQRLILSCFDPNSFKYQVGN